MTFQVDMSRIVEKTQKNLELLTRKTIFDMEARLVMRSPVGNPILWKINDSLIFSQDSYTSTGRFKKELTRGTRNYTGGRFRGNWQYGKGGMKVNINNDLIDKDGGKTLARLRSSYVNGPGVHYITNSLPYATRLEKGHSSQAPMGIVGLTVMEFRGILKDNLNAIVGGRVKL